jgi:hypothetical protein
MARNWKGLCAAVDCSGMMMNNHHHQPIKDPTAGAQAFLMDYTQGEWAVTHHTGLVWVGGCEV